MAHLLFGGSNRAGLAAIDSALDLGHHVTFLMTPGMGAFFRDAPAQRTLSRVRIVELATFRDVDLLTQAVARIHAADHVDAALTVFDAVVQPFAEACARCQIRATSARAIALARDKAQCRDRLRQHGIAQLPSRRVATPEQACQFAQEHGFPLILKPNSGLASMLVQRVDSERQIHAYFADLAQAHAHIPEAVQENIELRDSIIVERYVAGDLYSVEAAVTAQGTHCLVLSRRKRDSLNDAIELGSTMPGTTDEAVIQRAYAYVTDILSALGMDRGIFHVELIIGEDAIPHLVEVNPRLMGGTSPSLYNLASGRNVFEDLVHIHLDAPIAEVRAPRHAVASRVIGAARDWVVRDDLPPDWIDGIACEMAYHGIQISQGQTLPRMTHNYHSLGQFQVRAQTPQEADIKADRLLEQISRITGVPLCH
ncbi:MAG: ATP-grasp domain-containing protein [Burkholderiaceae bacterium]|jgi:biotin carboxylase|nr:ATP-grasp domain-containing protein [Burkholderiaceae bacterium]